MSFLENVNRKFRNWQAEEKQRAERRAERQLERAKTNAQRRRILADLEVQAQKRRKEIAEARTATLKAEAARRRAAKEVKDLGDGGFMGEISKMLGYGSKKAVKRRVVKRTIARKKK